MILALAPAALAAADTAAVDRLERVQKTYPKLYEIVQLARGVPSEFGAAALIRVATAAQMKDAGWSVELLTEAFEMAAGAQEPIPRRVAAGTVGRGAAYGGGLDRLSLQSSAVIALVGRNPAAGRELMERLPRPAVRSDVCTDALVDDPSGYYRALTVVVNQAYSAREHVKALHLVLADAAVGRMSSAAEIAPVARMIGNLRLTPAELDGMIAEFAAALERIEGDDRTFSWALPEADKAIRDLALRVSKPQAMLSAFRSYAVRQFTGARCEDTVASGPLNTVAAALGLSASELKPARTEGRADSHPEFVDPESQRLQREFMMLLAGNGARGLSDAEKSSEEWQDRLDRTVRAIEEWRPSTAKSDSDILDARRDMIGSLVWITPAGPTRDKLLNEYVDLLRSSGSRPDSWMVWFVGFDTLLRLSTTAPGGEKGVLDAFERSGHPVLVLYAKLERVLPSPFRPPAVQ